MEDVDYFTLDHQEVLAYFGLERGIKIFQGKGLDVLDLCTIERWEATHNQEKEM